MINETNNYATLLLREEKNLYPTIVRRGIAQISCPHQKSYFE